MKKQQMTLVFRRTGQRRYGVEVQRAGLPDLEMNPAPGFDPLMPHDMMHLVVEAQLGRLNEWRARSSSPEQKAMAQHAKQVQYLGATELPNLNQRKLDEICKHLDQLSSRWSSLSVGESLAVTWPDLAIAR